jgi:hypothetical protein
MTTLPCIVCNKALEPAMEDADINQPYGGLAFQSEGHYGSTVFDPMDDTYLEINICDECLLRASELRVRQNKIQVQTSTISSIWRPHARLAS